MIFDSTMTRALTLRNDIAISVNMLTSARVTNACSHKLKYFTKTTKNTNSVRPANKTPAAIRIGVSDGMASNGWQRRRRPENENDDRRESALCYGKRRANANIRRCLC